MIGTWGQAFQPGRTASGASASWKAWPHGIVFHKMQPITPLVVLSCEILPCCAGPASRRPFCIYLSARAENWPEFRGPTGQGLYSGKNLPIEWSTNQERRLDEADPRQGLVVPHRAGRPHLPDQRRAGRREQDLSLQALCLDAESGKELWQTEVFRRTAPRRRRSTARTATPARRRSLTVNASTSTSAIRGPPALTSRQGPMEQHRPALQSRARQRRHADPRRRTAHLLHRRQRQAVRLCPHTADGKLAWKTNRKSEADRRFSFSTPLLIEVNGQKQVISPASDAVMA